jgi:negative regulator of flagellin synthesis FlgM
VARPDAKPIQDELQISAAARAAESLQGVPDVRQARIAAIRAEIAAGTYETADKLDVAVSRLLDEIG